VAQSVSIPVPIGGWDTRQALSMMDPTHAVILDNWFPGTAKLTLRKGNTSYATGMAGSIESLIPYVPLTGAGKLFAANGGNIFDISSSGAVGSAVVSGMTNARWQHVNIGTAAGQFLLAFNGADVPRTYNGSSWSTFGGTGPTVANLIWCNLHQRRLWFGEEDSLSAWYLATNAITGTATEFPLHGIARKGGFLMAMGTWTRDSGAGMDDVAVFLTSEGEAIIYVGTDPSAAATWELIGVFRIGKPIGRRCMVQGGSDLILVTQDGFVPLSGILSTDRSQARLVALSDQINEAVNVAVTRYGSVYGWQPIVYAQGTMLIFNIPKSATESIQYIFNTITGAPCRFTGINAVCFGPLEDDMYWGGNDGVVYKFDDGTSDNGTEIEADAVPAFSYFGLPDLSKLFKLAEPIFESDGNPNPAVDVNTDFQVAAPTGLPGPSSVGSAIWGSSTWGSGTWGSEGQIYRGWRGVRGVGRAGSVRIRLSSSVARPSWISTNLTFVNGGQI